MSAVQERERRATAGKRLTFLAGQELENDEAFWGHETWAEDSESFHSSDADDDENAVDEFDSDFDESESDREDEEQAMGAAEERQIAQEERDTKRRQATTTSAYTDTKKGSKGLLRAKAATAIEATEKRGRWGKSKRIMGNGLNAGIVLNVPLAHQRTTHPPLPLLQPAAASSPIDGTVGIVESDACVNATTAPSAIVGHDVPIIPVPPSTTNVDLTPTQQSQLPLATLRKKSIYRGLASSRTRRSEVPKDDRAVASSLEKPTTTTAGSTAAFPVTVARKVKRTFTQAELLLEAVKDTEPENKRWLLGRKRQQAEKDETEAMIRREHQKGVGEVIEKFVSRRGCLNTILFPSMDHVPPILYAAAHADDSVAPVNPAASVSSTVGFASAPSRTIPCVISGKVARYRDPLTGQGYHDAVAFRELRRRYDTAQTVSRETMVSARVNGTCALPRQHINTAVTARNGVDRDASKKDDAVSNGSSLHVDSIESVVTGKTPSPKKSRGRPKSAEKHKKLPGIAKVATQAEASDRAHAVQDATTASFPSLAVPSGNFVQSPTAAPQSRSIFAAETSMLCTNNVPLSEHGMQSITAENSLQLHASSPPSPGRRSERKRTLTARMRDNISTGLLLSSPKGSPPPVPVSTTPKTQE